MEVGNLKSLKRRGVICSSFYRDHIDFNVESKLEWSTIKGTMTTISQVV